MNDNQKLTLKERIKSIPLKKKIKFIASAIIVIALVVVGIFIGTSFNKPAVEKNVVKPDTKLMLTTLTERSDLVTGELTFYGVIHFKDGGIKVLNRSDFTMSYQATALIGIDVKEITLDTYDLSREIIVSIPKAKAINCKINTKEIKFYDEKLSLFNTNEKEDQNKAISQAEEDAIEKLNEMGIFEMSNKQAEALIIGILSPLVPDGYTIKAVPLTME